MKTFLQFITERRRNRSDATKLLNRLYKSRRYNKIDNPLRHGYSDDMDSLIPLHDFDISEFKKNGKEIEPRDFVNAPLRHVPISSMVTRQQRVSRSVIAKKLQNKFKDHDPEHPWIIQHNGVHYLDDGNHRANKEKLRGRKHILARVVDADEYHKGKYTD